MTNPAEQKQEDTTRYCPFTGKICTPQCPIYIQVQKPIMHTLDNNTYPDETFFHAYAGCGLVKEIPWILVQKVAEPQQPETPKTEATKQ